MSIIGTTIPMLSLGVFVRLCARPDRLSKFVLVLGASVRSDEFVQVCWRFFHFSTAVLVCIILSTA